jgi:tocopherol O-methyltransferase
MISTRAIRAHYDRLSFFYRRFWGEHIHHGFWKNGESARQAQLNLIEELARRANIARGGNVLDVGCGLGASAIWLAQELHCSVTGITISPVQKRIAERRARYLGLNDRVQFLIADANKLRIPAATFDAVWVIECSEHLFDKQQFIRECWRVLRSDGVLALASWLSGAAGRHNHELISEICSGMLCPSLATFAEYQKWMVESGFEVVYGEEIGGRVAKTWHVCEAILERPIVRVSLPLLGRGTRAFTGQFSAMRRAFASEALGYGMFAARKK